MDRLPPDIRDKVVSMIRHHTCQTSLCQCNSCVTVAIKSYEVTSMTNGGCILNAKILGDSFPVRSDFMGFGLQSKQCDHEQFVEVKLYISDLQWQTVVQHSRQFVVIGGHYKDAFLDCSSDSVGVVPLCLRKDTVGDFIRIGELFAGGFSGWTHVVRALQQLGYPLELAWAIDCDASMVHTYCQSHPTATQISDPRECLEKILQPSDDEILHWVFQEKIQQKWWVAVATMIGCDVLALSPPCPPWSMADKAPGLSRYDGMISIIAICIIAYIRPKVMVLENVGSMKSHQHFLIIQSLLRWANYTIRWQPSLELEEVVPQKRDRLILIATDDFDSTLQGHACDFWPKMTKHTLKSFEALMELDTFWSISTKLTDDEKRMYLDPKFLPKGTFSTVQVKRTRNDLMKYRLRTPEDIAACFLTSYGNPTGIDPDLLQRGGLYGALVLIGDSVRKFAIPEIACLQVPLASFWLPGDERSAIKALGNAIASPHAAIGFLNALHFLNHHCIDQPVHDIFLKLMSKRMHSKNMLVEHVDGGFRFEFRVENLSLPSTIQIRSFARITVQSPTLEYEIICESGVPVLRILEYITGPSVPASVALKIDETHDFAVPVVSSYCMPDVPIRIRTNVPSELHLCEKAFEEQLSFSPAIVVLYQGQIYCVLKRPNLTCGDIVDVLRLEDQTVKDDFRLFMLNGDMWDDDRMAPDVVFLGKRFIEDTPNDWCLKNCRFLQQGPVFALSLRNDGVKSFLTFLHSSAIMRDVRSLGWHFVSEWSCDRSHDSRLVMLAQIPGALSVSVGDIREFIMARIFKTLLQRWTLHHHTERTVQVTLKAWNTVVWKGQIRAGQSCHAFVSLWNLTMSIFGLSTPPRFVCCGKQMNPEWNIMDFADQLDIPMLQITIHIVKAFHGGSDSSDSEIMSIQSSQTDDERSTPSADDGFERDVSNMLEHWLDIREHLEFYPVSLAWFQRHHVTVLQQAVVLEGHIDRVLPIMKVIHKLGVESTLYDFGWHMILKFLSFDAPVEVRMIIEPMNTWEPGDTERVVAFIMSALFVASLPDPTSSVDAVCVSMKVWHTWAVEAQFPGDMLLSVVDDTWQCMSAFMSRHSSIRLITQGRSASIDFPIRDFARVDFGGRLCVKFIIVLPLHGGGPSQKMLKSENNIATKNTLAAFLLSLGCELQSVSSFVQKILDATGPVAIDQIMKIQQTQKKHEALSKLAVSMSIQFPDVNSAASKRMHQVQKKVTAKGIPPQIIQPEQFQIKDGFFCNEDKSSCSQITQIRAGASGIALVAPDTAAQWLKCDSKISADELALITLGTCPTSTCSPCSKIQFPVFDKEGQPAVLAGCIHQLGQKKVTFGDSKQCDIAVADTAVVAITLHRQELENIPWENVVRSPCRVCFDIISKQIGEVICPCQPWGRSWQKGEARVKPDQATSFQCHLRIPNDRLHDVMRISGNCGLFSTPKDPNHQVDKSFSVIWDDRSLDELQVLAASMQSSLGIVVSIRAGGKKVSRGIRCKRSDYQDVFKLMKPGITIPSAIVINHVAKIAPTPIGASAEDISSFLEKMSWEAKPLKPLGGECWLIGATTKFDDVFGSWNQQVVMVSWLPPRNENMKNKVVMAATKPIHEMVGSDQIDSLQVNDPWSQYKVTTNNSIKQDGRNSGPPRSIDGPIEQKFQSQGNQISTLQTQVEHISKQLEKQVQDHGEMKQSVHQEFCKIREETSRGLSDMQKSFDESLHKALQNQDLQLTRNFSELKNLILQKPNPMKKAKTAPAGSGQKRENDDDEEANE